MRSAEHHSHQPTIQQSGWKRILTAAKSVTKVRLATISTTSLPDGSSSWFLQQKQPFPEPLTFYYKLKCSKYKSTYAICSMLSSTPSCPTSVTKMLPLDAADVFDNCSETFIAWAENCGENRIDD